MNNITVYFITFQDIRHGKIFLFTTGKEFVHLALCIYQLQMNTEKRKEKNVAR